MEKTTPIKQDFITTELQKFETEFEINETGLVALRDSFKELKIDGQEDRAGLKVVETARKTLKSQRVKIKKASESLRESAVRFQKAVIEREKSLISIIEPTEDLLSGLEDDYYAEKERLRLEEEKKESDRIQAMLDQLNEVNYAIDFHTLKGLTDEQFAATLQEAKELHRIEAQKVFEEAERRKKELIDAENARLAQEEERKKLDAERAAFQKEKEQLEAYAATVAAKAKEEQDRIEAFNAKVAADLKAAQDKLDAERLKVQREKELEEAKKKAAEDARIEAEATAKRLQEEKIEAERLAKEQEEEKILAGDDSGRFTALRTLLTTNLLGDNVVIWTHFKSKKGKAAAAKVIALISEARQICIDNIK